MTPKQIELIKKCIEVGANCVEVGWINGVNPRTAEALVDAGILTYDWPINYHGTSRQSYVRLRKKDEVEL